MAEKSPYDILSDIYREDSKKLSSEGRDNLNSILGIKKSTDGYTYSVITSKLFRPFLKIDSLIFKSPPKIGNSFNKRGSWF